MSMHFPCHCELLVLYCTSRRTRHKALLDTLPGWAQPRDGLHGEGSYVIDMWPGKPSSGASRIQVLLNKKTLYLHAVATAVDGTTKDKQGGMTVPWRRHGSCQAALGWASTSKFWSWTQ